MNKRALGYLSWYLHRQKEHRQEVLNYLIQDLAKHKPDHVVITGDLTHLGLPVEFRQARQWLDSLHNIGEITVIPGNHEAYVATPFESTLQHWAPYLTSDLHSANASLVPPDSQVFPSLRIRGPIAFIGLSSAHPTPPFFATGFIDGPQLAKLERILYRTSTAGLFRVLLIHHPPLPNSVRWRKRLTNAKQLTAVLSQNPVNLILHGHSHQKSIEYLHTPTRSIPVIGVPSASAIGNKASYRAQYCLFGVNGHLDNFQLTASVHTYFPAKEQFHFDHTLSLSC